MVPTNGRQFFRGRNVSGSILVPRCYDRDNVSEEKLHFFVPPNLPPAILSATRALLNPANLPPTPETPSPVKWVNSPSAPELEAPLLSLDLPPSSGLAKHIAWHRKGDYFATVCKSFSSLEQLPVFR